MNQKTEIEALLDHLDQIPGATSMIRAILDRQQETHPEDFEAIGIGAALAAGIGAMIKSLNEWAIPDQWWEWGDEKPGFVSVGGIVDGKFEKMGQMEKSKVLQLGIVHESPYS